jgi:hypothetical protein
MPGQLGNIPTMCDQKTLLSNMQGSYGNMPITGGSYVNPPSSHATVFWFCGGGIPCMLLTPVVAFGIQVAVLNDFEWGIPMAV